MLARNENPFSADEPRLQILDQVQLQLSELYAWQMSHGVYL